MVVKKDLFHMYQLFKNNNLINLYNIKCQIIKLKIIDNTQEVYIIKMIKLNYILIKRST